MKLSAGLLLFFETSRLQERLAQKPQAFTPCPSTNTGPVRLSATPGPCDFSRASQGRITRTVDPFYKDVISELRRSFFRAGNLADGLTISGLTFTPGMIFVARLYTLGKYPLPRVSEQRAGWWWLGRQMITIYT